MRLPLTLFEGDDTLEGDDMPETVSMLRKSSLLMSTRSILRFAVFMMLSAARVKFYLVSLLSLLGLNEL